MIMIHNGKHNNLLVKWKLLFGTCCAKHILIHFCNQEKILFSSYCFEKKFVEQNLIVSSCITVGTFVLFHAWRLWKLFKGPPEKKSDTFIKRNYCFLSGDSIVSFLFKTRLMMIKHLNERSAKKQELKLFLFAIIMINFLKWSVWRMLKWALKTFLFSLLHFICQNSVELYDYEWADVQSGEKMNLNWVRTSRRIKIISLD